VVTNRSKILGSSSAGIPNCEMGPPTFVQPFFTPPPLKVPESLKTKRGKDALERIADKNAFVERETARWRALAESTNY
jgi:hypothetical protein